MTEAGPTQPLLEHITEALPTLRNSERKVATVVLQDGHRVVHLSMAGLAQAAGVSEPTVMRFCNAIGCAGFNAFRLRLAQALALGIPATHSAIEPGDTTEDLIGKVFDHTISSLDRARRGLDTSAILAAVDLLTNAREILFVGLGASGIIAQDAQQKFPLFGVPCSAPSDAHQQFIAASMSRPGTVVVAISNRGRTESVLEVARAARGNGAAVIGICGQEAPLQELCDITVMVKTFEDTDFYTPTISRLAGLVVIDILATAVVLRRGEEHFQRLQVMKEQLTDMRTRGHDRP